MIAGSLVGVAQSYCNQTSVIVCCALALALGLPAAFSGFMVNSIELAPNHAAAIIGLAGTLAHSASILAPYYVGYLINDNKVRINFIHKTKMRLNYIN